MCHYFSLCHHLLLPTAEGVTAMVKMGGSGLLCVQRAVHACVQQAITIAKD